MKCIKLYAASTDFSEYIKSKLSEEDGRDIGDHILFPIKMGINESDMSIEFLVAPIQK